MSRLALLLVVLAVAGVAAIVVHWPSGARSLSGETDQARAIELVLGESGRLVAVDTSVEARCRGGHRWSIDWQPNERVAWFRQRSGGVSVREVVERTRPDGRIERIGALLTGRLRGDRADGELRLAARFYRGAPEVQACDSGPRRWAAGSSA